ncbi:hypothetical protein AVEN_38204-1 [Araneus ventricosus]|uniref:Uncharacterized protein n=1 Tax=Araneus ventricosus TaxID=182803 RepID=A0A4Y2DU22_ARAVE|nr:hypothetical protein AVEN_38204-1 [Araneus ventricosus]
MRELWNILSLDVMHGKTSLSLPVAKMHLKVIKDYVRPVRFRIGRLQDGSKRFAPSMDYPGIISNVDLSRETVWHILKKRRMFGCFVAVINKQHLSTGVLRLPDIWQKIQNFAGDYIEGM